MLNKIKLIGRIIRYNYMLKHSANQITRDTILRFIDVNNKHLTHWKPICK